MLDVRAGPQPTHDAEPPQPRCPQAVVAKRHRNCDIDGRANLQTEVFGLGHADNRHQFRTHVDRLAEDARVHVETSFPVTVADDGNAPVRASSAIDGVVSRSQHPALDCTNAEQIEVVAGRVLTAYFFRSTVDRHFEAGFLQRGYAGQEPVLLAQPLEAGIWRSAGSPGF